MGLFAGLAILSKLKSIKDFMFKHWKITLAVLLLVIAFFKIRDMIGDAYDEGILYERAKWEERIKIENEKNRQIEKKLDEWGQKFEIKINNRNAERIEKETVYKNEIKTIVKDNPIYEQCVVDQSIIDLRNKMRAEGVD